MTDDVIPTTLNVPLALIAFDRPAAAALVLVPDGVKLEEVSGLVKVAVIASELAAIVIVI